MCNTKIAFTGDIAFSKYYKDKCDDAQLIDKKLIDFLTDSQYGVFNIEGAICRPPENTGMFTHTNNPDSIEWIKKLGGNIWNLANNHSFDADAYGCDETIKLAQSCGFKTIGAGKNIDSAATPVYIEASGGIGIFAAGYERDCKRAEKDLPGCLIWDEKEKIQETISEIKKTCRWCIMVIHGGDEFCDIPMRDVQERYREFLRMGADIIVGHHPHVPQNYERVGDKMIFYSLGNFIFDTDYQRKQPHTDTGVLLKLSFTETDFSFTAVGTEIDRENGHISEAPLPAVFTEFTERDYENLLPLAADVFFTHEKTRVIFIYPSKYTETSPDEVWQARWDFEIGRNPAFSLYFEEQKKLDISALQGYSELKEYLLAKVK